MTSAVAPVRPPFAYYGGKQRIALWIIDHLPPHRVYLEPFAGSCAVLLAKPPAPHEVLDDIDDNLVTFLRVLRDQPDELVRVCSLTPYARSEFIACEDRGGALPDLERARRTWVRIEQAFSGATGASHRMSWSTSVARTGGVAVGAQAKVDRFRAIADRLVRVTIDNRGALEAIQRYARWPDAVVYADPPYLAETRRRTSRQLDVGDSARVEDYACDFSTEDQHRALAQVLHETPAAVVLSGYHSPLYDELYGDWDRVERVVDNAAGCAVDGGRRHAVEVLWSSRTLGDVQGDMLAALA